MINETDPRNWKQDYEREGGKTQCICVGCGLDFLGHKSRVSCQDCDRRNVSLILPQEC